jgi:hypothetical protein
MFQPFRRLQPFPMLTATFQPLFPRMERENQALRPKSLSFLRFRLCLPSCYRQCRRWWYKGRSVKLPDCSNSSLRVESLRAEWCCRGSSLEMRNLEMRNLETLNSETLNPGRTDSWCYPGGWLCCPAALQYFPAG